jgi:hypothetical protein
LSKFEKPIKLPTKIPMSENTINMKSGMCKKWYTIGKNSYTESSDIEDLSLKKNGSKNFGEVLIQRIYFV